MKIWRLAPDTNSNYTGIIPLAEFFSNDELKHYWLFEIGKLPEGNNYKPIEVKKRINQKNCTIFPISLIE